MNLSPRLSKSSTSLLFRDLSTGKASLKKVTYQELNRKTNCDRALTHFDDFYGSFFGKRKWPALRLALLSPPKYLAVPNVFTGDVEGICGKLEGLGAYSLQRQWTEGREALFQERKSLDLKKDLGKIHSLERTLESIAVTKQAEEMELLYQNEKAKSQEEHKKFFPYQPNPAAFVPSTKLKGADDFAFDSEYYSDYLPQNLQRFLNPEEMEGQFVYTDQTKMKTLKWPMALKPFSFELGSGQDFPVAVREKSSDLREYICVNGASIAPVLALDPHPSCNLLDLCSGPGTKSLMSLMTMTYASITCNDLDSARLWRVKKIMKEFTGTEHPESVLYTRVCATKYRSETKFERVLADVPCSNDRVSLLVHENNIFQATRTKERLNLIHVQKDILMSAFDSVRQEDGCAVVYSTCTLSPVENDGVVMHALKETEIPNLTIDVAGLLQLLKPLEKKGFFTLSRTRFGVLIEPTIVSNFGPMYVSRIVVQKGLNSDQSDSEFREKNVDEEDNVQLVNRS